MYKIDNYDNDILKIMYWKMAINSENGLQTHNETVTNHFNLTTRQMTVYCYFAKYDCF